MQKQLPETESTTELLQLTEGSRGNELDWVKGQKSKYVEGEGPSKGEERTRAGSQGQ